MHIFLRGFVRARQKSARTGLSGGGLPPRLTGLFWAADLEAAPAAPAGPVCDCGGGGGDWCAFGNCTASGTPPTPPTIDCWPTMGGVAVEGVAAVGWAPGSRAGGPNAEPPSPPALIGRWYRAPCFLCYDDHVFFFFSCGDEPAIAARPSRWRRSTPIDAVSQRRPTTRCSSPACYGTGLLRSSLRDLRLKGRGSWERKRQREGESESESPFGPNGRASAHHDEYSINCNYS